MMSLRSECCTVSVRCTTSKRKQFVLSIYKHACITYNVFITATFAIADEPRMTSPHHPTQHCLVPHVPTTEQHPKTAADCTTWCVTTRHDLHYCACNTEYSNSQHIVLWLRNIETRISGFYWPKLGRIFYF